MKELNQLENSLHSWTPRPPSARIKQQLFQTVAAPRPLRELPDPLTWRWLLPATALFVGALILLAKSPRSSFDTGSGRAPTFALSNLYFSTYYASVNQNDHNILHRTFEWTNRAHSSTTHPSFFDRTRYRE